jgi:hypothetical protein
MIHYSLSSNYSRQKNMALRASLNKINTIGLPEMRWAWHVARMVAKRNAYRISMGKPEGKRLLGRPRRRWVDYIKMDLREIEWGGMD